MSEKIVIDLEKLLPFFPAIPNPTPEEIERIYADFRKRNPGEKLPETSRERWIEYFIEREEIKPLSEYDALRRDLQKESVKRWDNVPGEIEPLYVSLWGHDFDYSDFHNLAYVWHTYFHRKQKDSDTQDERVQISRDYIALREWVATLWEPQEIEHQGKTYRANRLLNNANRSFKFDLKARATLKGVALDGFSGAQAIPINEKSEVYPTTIESREVKHKFIDKMDELLRDIEQQHGTEAEHRQRVNQAKGYGGSGATNVENELLLGLAGYTDKYHPNLKRRHLFVGRFLACCGMYIQQGKAKGFIHRCLTTGKVTAENVYNPFDENLYQFPESFEKAIRERLRRIGYPLQK